MESRRPARFALGSPLALCFRFSDANLGPRISELEARRPPWFALVFPLSVFGREPRAGDFGVGGPVATTVRARLPDFGFRARTSGREFRGWRPVVFSRARFAPRSPLALSAPFRGAKSSHISRAPCCPQPAFSGRGLLPPPRYPLQLRFGEQNLHTFPAPPAAPSGRF